MAKMVNRDPSSPVRTIDDRGQEYQADDNGEFDVEDEKAAHVGSKFNLVEKGQQQKK